MLFRQTSVVFWLPPPRTLLFVSPHSFLNLPQHRRKRASPRLWEKDIKRNRASARQRDKERWERARKGEERRDVAANFFFLFFLSSPKPAAHFGQWFSKIDFRKRVREWRERGRGRGGKKKTCGDFRNSCPKLYQMMLCRTLWNCSHTQSGSAGETGPLLSQTLSQFISYLGRQTQLYSKYCKVLCRLLL